MTKLLASQLRFPKRNEQSVPIVQLIEDSATKQFFHNQPIIISNIVTTACSQLSNSQERSRPPTA